MVAGELVSSVHRSMSTNAFICYDLPQATTKAATDCATPPQPITTRVFLRVRVPSIRTLIKLLKKKKSSPWSSLTFRNAESRKVHKRTLLKYSEGHKWKRQGRGLQILQPDPETPPQQGYTRIADVGIRSRFQKKRKGFKATPSKKSSNRCTCPKDSVSGAGESPEELKKRQGNHTGLSNTAVT